ncbi:lysophospholipase [Stipitochalara longipes BDJ]|nr:lysophospholipase [Stipitochalara longipes BDJ]
MKLYLISVISSLIGLAYAPVTVPCPKGVQWIRPATGLSKAEADWIYGRKQNVLYALEEYLERLQIADLDAPGYIARLRSTNFTHVPTLGLAISGGGWASAFTGTGALRALDSRLEAATKQRTGGLLQSMTYMSGLSGGSWPIMSFATNNFPTADEILSLWQPQISRTDGVSNTSQYAPTSSDIFKQIAPKLEAGYLVSIVADYLGRAFSYQFVPGPTGGLGTTFSGVADLSKFRDHEMPFPIIHYNEIDDNDAEFFGLDVPNTNATMYDITPFEFGAWNGSISAFTPTWSMGTKLSGGSPINESACIRGFDRAGFVIGASANAFNFWYIEAFSNGTEGQFSKRDHRKGHNKRSGNELAKRGFSTTFLSKLPAAFQQVFGLNISQSMYASIPNPFLDLESASSQIKNSPNLRLVDGSESGQAIPLWGQIQPARGVEFIIAWDNNQDAAPYNWNNGTNLYHTYLAANASGIPFPIVPSAPTMINRNYTTRPVFFGCDPLLTTTGDANGPIVLYLGNAPYSAYTNYTYSQSSTSPAQMNDIFVNSFNQVTQGNGTLDSEWPVCLGCAAIDRSLAKIGMKRAAQCEKCLNRYCWDGKYDDMDSGILDPSLVLDPSLGFAEWNMTHDF